MSARGPDLDQRLLARGRGHVCRHRDHIGAGLGAYVLRGAGERCTVAAVDDDRAACARKLEGARASEAVARSADDGRATGDAKIHYSTPRVWRARVMGGKRLVGFTVRMVME